MPAHQTAPISSTHYLQQLQYLRALVWLTQALSLLLAHRWLQAVQLYTVLALLIGQLLLLAVSHGLLLRAREGGPVPGERAFFAQLLLDCLVLSCLLYVSGGATNPFVSYFLVPIALSAATLPRSYTVLLTAYCLAAYSALLFFYLPFAALSPHAHHHGDQRLSWHVLGMWLNFGLSALLITHFVATIAATVRRQREHINQLREQQLQDENILAVATLAAGAAHEIGTPLASVAVLLGDLRDEHRDNTALAADLQLLAGQVARCQQSLSQLADTARAHQAGDEAPVPVAAFIERLLRDWQVLRPEAGAVVKLNAGPAVTAQLPLVLEQALINLLNNAADASRVLLQVRVHWDARALVFEIDDDGPGIAGETLQNLRSPQPSDKGMGLGLMLSHATLERLGGRLQLAPRHGGGTCTRVTVPLRLLVEEGVA